MLHEQTAFDSLTLSVLSGMRPELYMQSNITYAEQHACAILSM